MKKTLGVLLLCAALLLALASPFCAVSGLFRYKLVDGAAVITAYVGTVKNVTLPDTLGGCPVKALDIHAFDASPITQITLNASLETIGGGAFDRCASLTAIHVAEGNEFFSSADGVLFDFEGKTLLRCPQKMAGVYTVPEGTETIAAYAFEDCSALTGVVLPEGVVTVSDYAFASCPVLASVTLPSSLVTLSNGAFYNDPLLTSLFLKEDLAFIGDYVFYRCNALADINVVGTNEHFASEDGVLFSKDKTKLIACPPAFSGEYTMPETVRTVGYQSFMGCSKLTGVTFPYYLKTVEAGAFSYCTSLTAAILPHTVTYLGSFAFDGCTALETVQLPYYLDRIRYGTFNNCSSLKALEIPDSVVDFENYSFYNCASLTSVRISSASQLANIGRYVFQKCVKLPSICIPDTVKKIGQYAFNDCDSLTTVYVPSSVVELGSYSFYSCDALKILVVLPSVTGFGGKIVSPNTTIYAKTNTSEVYKNAVAQGYNVKIVSDLDSYKPKFPAPLPEPVIEPEPEPEPQTEPEEQNDLSPRVAAAYDSIFERVSSRLVFDYVAGLLDTLPPEMYYDADVNRDGVITLDDVIKLYTLEQE